MLKISNIKIYDLEESIIACRNAMRTELPEYTEWEFIDSLKRAKQLCKSSSNSGHNNFLCGIRVSFDLVYPNYISPELQRYHFFDIITSSSKMHRLSAHISNKCFNKYVDTKIKDILQEKADKWTETGSYEDYMDLLSNTPQGIELFMRCSTNYLQLKNIYHQRKNHKLKEDWGAFCKIIEELPYFKEFINNG